jgi:5-methyltetrahydrofolate--homocysteine methyltransferase
VVDKSWWKPPLLLDGGMGTLLFQMGLETGKAPDSWLLEEPEKVERAHRAYVEAGSDIIQTNTFGSTPAKLAAAGLGCRCAELNTRAVEIARRASEGKTLVAGNIGPTGRLFPPMGTATEGELYAEFLAQAEALASASADLLNIETMFDLREAICAVRAASTTGLVVFASMTFDKKKRGHFTIVGDRIGPSLTALSDAGARVVGMNCSVTPAVMLPMIQEARDLFGGSIIAQPNAGDPQHSPAGIVYDADPVSFAADLLAMVEVGVDVIGGCCGSTPEFIRKARTALDERK